MIVVADTGPLNYLILIGQVDLLSVLYSEVTIPPAVVEELSDMRSPPAVRAWLARPPEWLHIRAPQSMPSDLPVVLGSGEREAIALSAEVRADALLIDERDGRAEAKLRKVPIIGTLGTLSQAAREDLVDLAAALAQLKRTNFRASDRLYEEILLGHRGWGKKS
ncbi:MAG: DUF3368 domain-containing protein [Acidobacteriaceae bacterium]|nr:DUF3368 domain-containing protein [Acidobacteriaceae bacterium]